MLKRPIPLLLVFGVALAGPYLISRVGPASEGLASLFGSGTSESDLPKMASFDPKLVASPDGPGSLLFPSQAPLEGPPTQNLEDVLRFDISREWVYARWRRKSAGLADPELFGVRVPLVTGTSPDALAGSLSYYFEDGGRLARISFRGRTGDLRPLVQLLTTRFHLRSQPAAAPGEQLYQLRWSNSVQSELRARPAAVVWESSPYNRFEISLELNRPGSNRFMKRQPTPVSAKAQAAET